MGISNRCTGVNLLNHIKQKKLFETIEVIFTQIMDLEDEEVRNNYLREQYHKSDWIVELRLDDNHYTTNNKTKRAGLLDVLNQSNSTILDKLNQ